MKKGPGCVCFIMPGIGLRVADGSQPAAAWPTRIIGYDAASLRFDTATLEPFTQEYVDEGLLTEEHQRRLLEKGKKVRDAVLSASP